jgi:hypothetical protein
MRGSFAFLLTSAAVLPLGACGIFGADPPPPPPDEATFVAVEAAFKSAFEDARDDVLKAKLEQQWRNKDSCSLIAAPHFANWTGTMQSVDRPLTVDIGAGITLRDDSSDPPSASNATSGLEEGDPVRISGRFVSDDAACPAQYVGTPWDEKAIERPAYKVRLSSVERVQGR